METTIPMPFQVVDSGRQNGGNIPIYYKWTSYSPNTYIGRYLFHEKIEYGTELFEEYHKESIICFKSSFSVPVTPIIIPYVKYIEELENYIITMCNVYSTHLIDFGFREIPMFHNKNNHRISKAAIFQNSVSNKKYFICRDTFTQTNENIYDNIFLQIDADTNEISTINPLRYIQLIEALYDYIMNIRKFIDKYKQEISTDTYYTLKEYVEHLRINKKYVPEDLPINDNIIHVQPKAQKHPPAPPAAAAAANTLESKKKSVPVERNSVNARRHVMNVVPVNSDKSVKSVNNRKQLGKKTLGKTNPRPAWGVEQRSVSNNNEQSEPQHTPASSPEKKMLFHPYTKVTGKIGILGNQVYIYASDLLLYFKNKGINIPLEMITFEHMKKLVLKYLTLVISRKLDDGIVNKVKAELGDSNDENKNGKKKENFYGKEKEKEKFYIRLNELSSIIESTVNFHPIDFKMSSFHQNYIGLSSSSVVLLHADKDKYSYSDDYILDYKPLRTMVINCDSKALIADEYLLTCNKYIKRTQQDIVQKLKSLHLYGSQVNVLSKLKPYYELPAQHSFTRRKSAPLLISPRVEQLKQFNQVAKQRPRSAPGSRRNPSQRPQTARGRLQTRPSHGGGNSKRTTRKHKSKSRIHKNRNINNKTKGTRKASKSPHYLRNTTKKYKSVKNKTRNKK
jgi:hypothetical protein